MNAMPALIVPQPSGAIVHPTAIVERGAREEADAATTFEAIYAAARAAAGEAGLPTRRAAVPASRSPRLTEPWFCCAEPTESQLGAVNADPERWV